MRVPQPFLALMVALAALMASGPALAHGLQMKLDAENQMISGQVYFSNGKEAEGVWVELFDDRAPETAIETVQTGPDGTFRVEGEQGRGYQVRASGEEGHSIALAIALEGEVARVAMIEDPADGGEASVAEIPAWAILGGFLALSLIPALWFRKRRKPASES